MKNINKVSYLLEKIGAIKPENAEVFSIKTRDNNELKVYRDSRTKVIYIDDFYIGEEVYKNGEYSKVFDPYRIRDLEDCNDSYRRFNNYKQFIIGKQIVDFGCGKGSFLRQSKNFAKSLMGIELQQNYVTELNEENIKCFTDINEVENEQDSFFLFHCLEHLKDPDDQLKKIHSKLKSNGQGKIIIEVPHAKDFLIDSLNIKSFIDFTLWSQHLVLHTRESLRMLLEYCGFNNVIIEGIQRYSISNHLNWVINNKPGGHKEILSLIETHELINAYASALSKIDANDTLIAIAST